MTSLHKILITNLTALPKGEKPYSESPRITLCNTVQNEQNDVKTNRTTTGKRPNYCF